MPATLHGKLSTRHGGLITAVYSCDRVLDTPGHAPHVPMPMTVTATLEDGRWHVVNDEAAEVDGSLPTACAISPAACLNGSA
jgi:hypothetical protein